MIVCVKAHRLLELLLMLSLDPLQRLNFFLGSRQIEVFQRLFIFCKKIMRKDLKIIPFVFVRAFGSGSYLIYEKAFLPLAPLGN